MSIIGLGIATFYGLGSKSTGIIDRQIVFTAIGLAIMIMFSFFDYRILKNHSTASIVIYSIAVALLSLALASRAIRGVSSWIIFGNFTFEPAEFAKLAVLILLAKYFSQKHVEIYRAHYIIASGIYMLVPTVLTLLQPDLGSVIVFVILWLAMLLFAGIKRKHLLVILMLSVIVGMIGWFSVLKPYQKDRIISFINPYLDPRGSGYNTLQAQVSFGSGGLMGIAFDKNTDQKALVPEPYNDFVFAAFARKFGFAGVILLLALLTALIARIGFIASRADNNFAKLFSLGFMTIILTHVFVNIGMNMGLLPITGIPFSFLSYGGSHLITLMIGLGLIQNINLAART